MVAGYHLIWTGYGWWLPNDPRGSSSHNIRMAHIAGLGELHRGRKAVQPASRDIREFYEQARQVLKHPLMTFLDEDIRIIGGAFASVVCDRRYTCYACAIMLDHVHVLIRKHRDKAEEMVEQLQQASREQLIDQQRRTPDHPVWGGLGWKVFLETRADMRRTVRYIEDNPEKAGRPRQRWEFVKQYDGWLPGNPFRRAR